MPIRLKNGCFFIILSFILALFVKISPEISFLSIWMAITSSAFLLFALLSILGELIDEGP